MPITTISKDYCSKDFIVDGNIGMLSFILSLLSQDAFQLAGEEKSVELFIRATSPDRLNNPRKGSELWAYLKDTFPSVDGGIDQNKISREMADIFIKEVTGF